MYDGFTPPHQTSHLSVLTFRGERIQISADLSTDRYSTTVEADVCWIVRYPNLSISLNHP